MGRDTVGVFPTRQHTRAFHSRSSSKKTSTSSIDSALSGFTEPAKPKAIASLLSLGSTTLGSTPSLTLSSVKSTETLNYDGTRRMSVPVMPANPTATTQEKYAGNMATKKQLDELTTTFSLPELAQGKWNERWRNFRYGIMSMYMRLWALVILTNVTIIIAMICKVILHPRTFTYSQAAIATGANLLIAALMRHEHCINLLFRLATALPYSTPLSIRRQAAKAAYSNGGVHSGCGISALLWYIMYTGLAIAQFKGTSAESIALATTSGLTLLCLFIIITMAHPKIRTRYHDQWEMSHRFAGWTAIALVWSQTIVLAVAAAHHTDRSLGAVLIKTPTFWFLIIITCCLTYPWLRLRRRKVEAEVLSTHAVRLWFKGKTMPSCVGARLSHKPLMENHGFATIPNAKPTPSDLEKGLAYPEKAHTRSSSNLSSVSTTILSTSDENEPKSPPSEPTTPVRGKGYSIIVSRAGDFTSNLIENAPTHIYTRGAPTRGVLHIANLFKPIIVVATGSGIGPCLSFLQVYPDYPMRVLWSARTPRKTYGDEVVDAVLRADRQAVVIDTQEVKKPDLSAISYALAREAGAEAVVIISNPFSTRKVVFALENRGVPAFGAIFDS